MTASEHAAALATLAAGAGVNVAEGQIVVVSATLGQEALAREIAGACYDRGADYVEVNYLDPHLRRTRLTRAADRALGTIPPWLRRKKLDIEEAGGATIALTGPPAPHALDDVDPGRIGRDQVVIPEAMEVVARRRMRWTVIPGPTPGWAGLVFGEETPDALARLWEEIGGICRLDADDPVQAWRERGDELVDAAMRLRDAELDALRFRGPGTDLTVGLLPGMRWEGGGMTSADGVEYLPNIPTEEVFTSPDPERTEGTVAATRPLLVSDRTVSGLRVRFERGRAVQVEADEGAELIRELIARDEGAARLGEVALVDAASRIGESGLVFHDTLLDENAASHIALGFGFGHLAEDERAAAAVNASGIHTDFMIGGPEVEVTGTTRDGRKVPVLMGGRWAR
ncbi:MAG TPA: aminopeptidase [Solirubrobacteraceae bacterium]|nr:aminopeptidase [Solirubrobacteraceae bacterium]